MSDNTISSFFIKLKLKLIQLLSVIKANKHVNKTILEAAQLINTNLWIDYLTARKLLLAGGL